MSRFVLDPEVRSDLDEIWNYVAIAKAKPAAARGVIERLFAAFSVLAAEPLLGEKREDLGMNVRAFVVRPYLVLYRPQANGVQIAQVVHSARDIHAVVRTMRNPAE
jgi:toxin ParE1/3/4